MEKKKSIIALYEILSTYSDENHILSRKEIEHLLAVHYNITIHRNTLHNHIEILKEFGCDIQNATSAYDGYYINQRLFEVSEIHLLCNAIYAAHFIPEKASSDLIKKLLSTQSQYTRNDFIHTVYMKSHHKSDNKEFFLNIELLMEAIQNEKTVSFTYLHYNLQKQLVPRKQHDYIIHPYYIVSANENYYLICKHDHYDNLSHYRIDKMKNIQIMSCRKRRPLLQSFDPYAYITSKIYMYGGEEERITLQCSYHILDDIIDRFGRNVIVQPLDSQYFLAIVTASRQGLIYFCLQYVAYCEVTAPIEVKQTIYDMLCAAMNRYKARM